MSVTTPAPSSPQDLNMAAANAAVPALGNTVRRNPSLAAAVIQAGDPSLAAPASAASQFSSSAQALVDHQTNHASGGFLQSALNDVTSVAAKVTGYLGKAPGVSTLMNWANKPLQEIQKDYKFVSAVYSTHGVGEGLLATLGVLAGTGLGAAFGGSVGAAAGTDLAAALERNIFGRLVPEFHDALLKSQDPNYKVSLGRELATGLSNIPGFGSLRDTQHGIGQFVSGAADATADLEFDPLIVGGKVSAGIKSGAFISPEFKNGPVDYARDAENKILYQEDAAGRKVAIPIATDGYAQSASGIQKWLLSKSQMVYTPQQLLDTYDLQKAMQAKSTLGKIGQTLNPLPSMDTFVTAADHIGELKNVAQIAHQYPDLVRQITPRVLAQLAKANDGREVAQVLAQSLHSGEMFDDKVSSTIINLNLPTRTLGRALYGKTADKIRQKAGDTNIGEEPNLLLPKRVPLVIQKPLLSKNGAQVIGMDGQPVIRSIIRKNADGTNQTVLLKGGLFSGDVAKALNGKIRTFTGYKALSVDAANLAQSGREINLSSNDAAVALYNMARYTMGHQVALDWASKIVLDPDKAAQAASYGTLVKEILKAGGVSEDSNLLDHVMSEAQRFTQNGSPVNTIYGASNKGDGLGQMQNKQSATIAGDETTFGNAAPWALDHAIPRSYQNYAIWSHQHGSAGIIDFKALRREIANANLYNKAYIKADDFFTAYTEKIFAPLTLFTTGFGIRVAANEALHQVIRHGLGDYIEHRLTSSALKFGNLPELRAASAKLVEGLTDEDVDAAMKNKLIRTNSVVKHVDLNLKTQIALGFKHPFGAVSYKIAPYLAADKIDFIAKFQNLFAGMTLPSGSASGHLARYGNASAEEIDQGIQHIAHGKVAGQDVFGLFDRYDPQHIRFWAQGLQKLRHEEAARDIARDYIQNSKYGVKYTPEWDTLTEDQRWQKIAENHTLRVADPKKYENVRAYSAGMKNVEAEEFAGNQVADFHRQVSGYDGTIHDQLIRNVMDGKPTYSTDLKEIPVNSRPMKVLGKQNRPTTSNPYERVIETGYRTFINPVVDFISREPIFNHYAFENYRDMKPMVDAGLLSDDDAIRLAAQKGMGQMIPLIHNPPLRSQFAVIHRNLMPFYFAQEQALKRVGRLIQSKPQAFRDFQMINQGMNNPGFVHTDANGTKYIVYPLLGEFGTHLTRGLASLGVGIYDGLPSSVTGSTNSLLSVFPELKLSSIGPFANIALTEMTKLFPALAPADNALTGGYPSTDWISALMPNSGVRDIWNGLTMNDKVAAVHNSWMSAVAAAAYHGDIPDGANGTTSYAQLPPASQQQIMDKIEMNARTNLFIKGLFAFFLPLSPGVTNDTYNKNLQTLRSEFVSMTLPKTQGGQGMDLKTATAEFMNKYGSRSVVYTQSKTTSGAGGASLSLAQSTIDWLSANSSIMSSNPNGAAYLVPQVAADSNALKVEQKLLSMHLRENLAPKDFIDATFVAKGWSDMGADLAIYEGLLKAAYAAGNKNLASKYTQAWLGYTKEYGVSNPIWYADYTNPVRTAYADKALSDLQELNSKGLLGNSPQAPGVKQLLSDYQVYHQILLQNTINNGARFTPMYTQVKNAWFNYVTELAATQPELANVINGVFKKVK